MTAAAAARRPKPKAPPKIKPIYGDYPDDAQLQMIDAYYTAMQERRAALGRARHGQVYTPWEIVQFLVRSALERLQQHYPAERLRDARLLDPCCGCGPFLVCAAREFARVANCTVRQALEHNVYGADIDLGAVLTARDVLRSMAPGILPYVMWADTLADFAWMPGRIDIDALDIAAVDAANKQFERAATAWIKGPALRLFKDGPPSGGDALRPLGVAHVHRDGSIDLHWRRADGSWLPVPADRPYPPALAEAAAP